MLGGVAGGLGKYFDVDPLIFRIGFGVSVFFGGLGAVAYLALLLFVPAEEDDGTVGEAPIQRSRWLAIAAAVGDLRGPRVVGIFDGDPFWFDGGWFIGGPLFLIGAVVALFHPLRRDRDAATRPAGIGLATVVIASALIALWPLAVGAAWSGATGTARRSPGVVIAIGVLLVTSPPSRRRPGWSCRPALALPLSAVAAADGLVRRRGRRPQLRAVTARRFRPTATSWGSGGWGSTSPRSTGTRHRRTS